MANPNAEEIIITPDMTPEEVAAMQNPSGGDDSDQGQPALGQLAGDASGTQGGNPQPQAIQPAGNAAASMEGRVSAAQREAEDAKQRAQLFEQNNAFLTRRAEETATEAAALRAKADAAQAEVSKLQRQIAQTTAPKLSNEEVQKLVDEHGEYGAKPFIEMKTQMLEMNHRHQFEMSEFKEKTVDLPKQIATALGDREATAKASAFNAALMDPTNGVPNLGVLLKDQTFVTAMQKDPWGKLQPFNAALASNDISAIATIKSIVSSVTGGQQQTMGADPGNAGMRSQNMANLNGQQTNRDNLLTEWNGMLDRGETVAAMAFAKTHKLMD
jgi:hypothetical protein